MEKKEMMDMAKAKGLDIAEDALQNLGEVAIEMVGMLVTASKTPYDDMIWAAVKGKAADELKNLIDKVDGQEG